MKRQERLVLEELSLKALGNKHAYKKIELHGLRYNDPVIKMKRVIRLGFDGIKQYLEKTIKVREDFLQAAAVLKKEEPKLEGSND